MNRMNLSHHQVTEALCPLIHTGNENYGKKVSVLRHRRSLFLSEISKHRWNDIINLDSFYYNNFETLALIV